MFTEQNILYWSVLTYAKFEQTTQNNPPISKCAFWCKLPPVQAKIPFAIPCTPQIPLRGTRHLFSLISETIRRIRRSPGYLLSGISQFTYLRAGNALEIIASITVRKLGIMQFASRFKAPVNLFGALKAAVYSLLTVRRSETIFYAFVFFVFGQIYIIPQL